MSIRESAEILMRVTRELDALSGSLLEVEKELSRLEVEITTFVEDFQTVLWEKSTGPEGEKLPPEAIRLALAHRAYGREKFHRYLTLRAARNRAKQRISDLREVVAAHRSIVSAAKTELEASEGPQPAYAGTPEYPRG